MNLYSVAIGEQYEIEANRLQESMLPLKVSVFTKRDVERKSEDNLINGLYHKANFANYIDEADGPIVFMDADMFTLSDEPFKDFKVKEDTDFAYVPYKGKWHLPDEIRQKAFEYYGHKINSGFLYFRNLEIAKKVCTAWADELTKRPQHWIKNEYDEWALMIALQNMPEIKIELLDSKWNDWELGTEEEILNSDSIFFQSHNFLDIIK
jgi:hypothetical protein